MKFSIAIPVRNGSNYMDQAIRSALNQTRPADEVLVIDDNSEDETAQIAQSGEWDGRVKYYFNATPTGFADAFNRAAEKAVGDFVTILHQDDLLDPEYLSVVETGLGKYSCVHAYTGCRYIDEEGNLLKLSPLPHNDDAVLYSGREYARRYLLGVARNEHIHRCPGVTTSRRLLREDCCYRKSAGHIADDDFFYRVGTFTDVIGVSRPLASYREHMSSATSSLKFLPLVLARDYLFQIRNWSDRAKVLDANDEVVFEQIAVKNLNETLYYSFRDERSEWRREALELAGELEALAPGALLRHLPFWARPFWAAGWGGQFRIACAYVRILAACEKLRNFLKS